MWHGSVPLNQLRGDCWDSELSEGFVVPFIYKPQECLYSSFFASCPAAQASPLAKQFSMNCKSKWKLKYVQENQSDELLAKSEVQTELLHLFCAKLVPQQLILLFLLIPIRSSQGKGCLQEFPVCDWEFWPNQAQASAWEVSQHTHAIRHDFISSERFSFLICNKEPCSCSRKGFVPW